MKYNILSFALFLIASLSFASLSGSDLRKRITFEFSSYTGEPIVVSLKKGISPDTIYTGNLDVSGRISFIVPPEYDEYTGMGSVSVGENVLDFIVAGENPVIKCNNESINGANVIFQNSPENESLQRWFLDQSARLQKIVHLTQIEPLYKSEDIFLTLVKKENLRLQDEQLAFEKELEVSPLYASRFIRMQNFLNRGVKNLIYADSAYMSSVRKYVLEDLDINDLYTSGLWFATLNGLIALYDDYTPYHKDFMHDMSVLFKRINDNTVYTTLAENLFSICEATGWNDMVDELAYFLINDQRIEQPEGKLKLLMTVYKLGKGNKAPELVSRKNLSNTLLVFYETGCGNCENEMQLIKGNYALLKKKGYEVISISADVDEHVFKNTSAAFPWKDRLCDLKGFSGTDFQNYGVIGTPAFYVIDRAGNIMGRYASLHDTGILDY